MAVVGTAVIDIVSNTAKFESGVRRAEKQLGAFTARAGAMAGVVAGAAVGALALLTKRSMENVDALAKQADRLNTNITALGVYKVQADLAGVGGDKFAMALQRQIVNLGKARDGTGETADMVKRLGLNIETLAGMRGDQQFEAIAAAISKLPTQIDRANAAAAIWGARDGAAMLNLIQEMGPGAAELRRQLEAMNAVVNRVDAAKIEAANDAMELATQSAVGLGNTIAVAVSPFIEQMAKQWTAAAVSAGGFRDSVHHGMMIVSTGVGVVADVLRGVHIGFKAIELAAYGAAAATNLVLKPFLNPEVYQASIDNLMRVRGEYDALVTSKMPSDGIRERFFEIIEGANNAAVAVAKAKEAAGGTIGDIEPLAAPDGKEAAQKEQYINDLYARNIELLTGKSQAQLQYQSTLTDLNELVARGTITQEEYNAAVGRAQGEFEKTGTSMSVFAEQAARNMQSAFADFLFDPFKDGLKGMLSGFAQILQRMAAEALAAQLFEGIGSWGKANSGAGGFMGALGSFASFFGGGRASGGPVSPGMMYEVNERGDPEVLSSGGRDYLLTGSAGGRVSPAKAGQQAVLNVNATTNIDARGTTPELLPRLERMVRESEERTERRVYQAIRRGYNP